MSDAAQLLKTVKKAALEAVKASGPVGILFGKVTDIHPLQIDVEQKMKLGAAQIILTRNVTEFETEVTVDLDTGEALKRHTHELRIQAQEGGDPSHTHEMTAQMEEAEMTHTHEIRKRTRITVHNGLAVGDEVILVRCQGGQKYIVVDRIG